MSENKVVLLDVPAQNRPFETELKAAFARVLASGHFINGPEVVAFEKAVAEFVGVDHAIGMSSGTDALLASLMALNIGPGDEVITTPFTFFATGGSISRVGAKPVFVDIDEASFNLNANQVAAAITENTKAIMPVHLYGQSADLNAIAEVCGDIPMIEDAAQSLGSMYRGRKVGSIGAVGCYSFFPSKNLGGFGDGGMVVTQDAELAERLRVVRAHGSKPKYFHKMVGGNFRLDALQAALLHVKLPHLQGMTDKRIANAARYDALFAEADLSEITPPSVVEDGHVFNQYVIRAQRRDELQTHLNEHGIGNAIYYPKPLHLQECFADLGYQAGDFPLTEKACAEALAIPVHSDMTEADQTRVIDVIRGFYA